jgi:hypothetical protein
LLIIPIPIFISFLNKCKSYKEEGYSDMLCDLYKDGYKNDIYSDNNYDYDNNNNNYENNNNNNNNNNDNNNYDNDDNDDEDDDDDDDEDEDYDFDYDDFKYYFNYYFYSINVEYLIFGLLFFIGLCLFILSCCCCPHYLLCCGFCICFDRKAKESNTNIHNSEYNNNSNIHFQNSHQSVLYPPNQITYSIPTQQPIPQTYISPSNNYNNYYCQTSNIPSSSLKYPCFIPPPILLPQQQLQQHLPPSSLPPPIVLPLPHYYHYNNNNNNNNGSGERIGDGKEYVIYS